MGVRRLDSVGIVVKDLRAAVAFFPVLGLDVEGEAQVSGRWVDRVLGLDGVTSDIVSVRTPDGQGRLELACYRNPPPVDGGLTHAPPNALGLHRVMFRVDDIDGVLARLRAHGAELLGEVVKYEHLYRLCYLRGPEGIILALAEELGG